jgi:hypothetical protein
MSLVVANQLPLTVDPRGGLSQRAPTPPLTISLAISSSLLFFLRTPLLGLRDRVCSLPSLEGTGFPFKKDSTRHGPAQARLNDPVMPACSCNSAAAVKQTFIFWQPAQLCPSVKRPRAGGAVFALA